MNALHVVYVWVGAFVFWLCVASFLIGLAAGFVDAWRGHRRLAADRRFVAATAQPLIEEPLPGMSPLDMFLWELENGWQR